LSGPNVSPWRNSIATLHRAQSFASRGQKPLSNYICKHRWLGRGADGWLAFQRYFVEQQCRPEVLGFSFEGAAAATPHPDFLAALKNPALRAVVICPSNPFISIDPILALSGVRQALRDCAAPVIAVSPVIGGKAIKGPTAKMLHELGLEVSAAEVARHYQEFLDGYVIDDADAGMAKALSIPTVVAKTLMLSLADRERVATTALAMADRLSGAGR